MKMWRHFGRVVMKEMASESLKEAWPSPERIHQCREKV